MAQCPSGPAKGGRALIGHEGLRILAAGSGGSINYHHSLLPNFPIHEEHWAQGLGVEHL